MLTIKGAEHQMLNLLAKIKSLWSADETDEEVLAPVSEEQFQQRWVSLKAEIALLVTEKTPIFMSQWEDLAQHKLNLSEKEMGTALESCLWALFMLRMVQEVEENAWPGTWIGPTLETLQREMDDRDEGCRIRYARGMLQEYAESGRKYGREAKVLYFGEWLWNCNAKNVDLQGDVRCCRALGEAFMPKDDHIVWIRSSR